MFDNLFAMYVHMLTEPFFLVGFSLTITSNRDIGQAATSNVSKGNESNAQGLNNTDDEIEAARQPVDPNATHHTNIGRANKQKTQRYGRPKAKPTTEGNLGAFRWGH